MNKVVISGAGGFIGRNLALTLLNKGVEVYGVDVSDKGFQELESCSNFKPILINSDNLNELDKLNDKEIDTFFHLGWGGSLLSHDLNNVSLQLSNIDMSMQYLEKMKQIGIKRVIFGSTSYRYMINNKTGVVCSNYGIAKKTTEDLYLNYCLKNNIECIIAILTNTFGWGDYSKKAVNTLLTKMINNEDLSLVDGIYKNDWVYIEDTVNGLISIAKKGNNLNRYYVGHEKITTFKEKIIEMAKIVDYKKNLVFGEYAEDSHVDYENLNAKKTYEDTNFKCSKSFEDSIKLTAEWLKEVY